MSLSLHPGVQRDVNGIMAYYRSEGGPRLADRFFEELKLRLDEIAAYPTRFPFYLGDPIMRRASLRKFPYLILYKIRPDTIRVSVVKHEKRHPKYGLWRN